MSDLIDRQAAIDALEREKTYSRAFREGYTPTNVFEKYNAGLTDGIKALRSLPSANQWIPCSERLPDAYKNVWLTLSPATGASECIRKLRWVRLGCWSDNMECFFDISLGTPIPCKPIAWMDIDKPEPWKGEDNA